MAAFNKINAFAEDVMEKVHNMGSDAHKFALTNTAPSSASSQLSDVSEIGYTNCSSRAATVVTSAQSGGSYTFLLADLVLTATGGPVGPFRYVYGYNDTSSGDRGWGYWDYGSSITLNDGETVTIDFTTSTFTFA